MSEANIEVVRKIYACFDAGDKSGFLDLVAEDVVWDHRGNENPECPINKLFEGRKGGQKFIETVETTQEVIAHEAHEFFASGDRVATFGYFKSRVTVTGKEFSSNWAQVFTIEDGLVTNWKLYFNFTAAALAYQH